MQAKTIVSNFIEAIKNKHFDAASSLLDKEGFEYVGPNMRFLDPEDMLAYQFGMAAIQKDLILRQISEEGGHVFAILNYRTDFEPIGDVRIALWFVINKQQTKIQKIESFYNAAVVENMLDGNLDGNMGKTN